MIAFSEARELSDFSNAVIGKVVYVFKDKTQKDMWQSNEDYKLSNEWINPVNPLYSLVVVSSGTVNGVMWVPYIRNNKTVDLNTWNPNETIWKSQVEFYTFEKAIEIAMKMLLQLITISIDKVINEAILAQIKGETE